MEINDIPAQTFVPPNQPDVLSTKLLDLGFVELQVSLARRTFSLPKVLEFCENLAYITR